MAASSEGIMRAVVTIGVAIVVIVLGVSAAAELLGIPIHDATCRFSRCTLVTYIRRTFGVPWSGVLLATMDVGMVLFVFWLYVGNDLGWSKGRSKVGRIREASSANGRTRGKPRKPQPPPPAAGA